MKFYIDFEGTQFSHEIISVGVVAENGDTFYSLVRSKCKVNKFITDLTGLTKEEINKAPDADEVFADLWDWIFERARYKNTIFYVYGSCDAELITETISHCKTFLANLCLCKILGNLQDYQKIATKTLHLRKDIGLVKLISAYRGEEVVQEHNSLEDARFLKELTGYINNQVKFKIPIEKKYYTNTNISLIDENKKCRYTGFGHTFKNLKNAATWVFNNQLNAANREKTTVAHVARKIENSVINKKPYFSVLWTKEQEN